MNCTQNSSFVSNNFSPSYTNYNPPNSNQNHLPIAMESFPENWSIENKKQFLESYYQRMPFPNNPRQKKLAWALDLPPTKVKRWFHTWWLNDQVKSSGGQDISNLGSPSYVSSYNMPQALSPSSNSGVQLIQYQQAMPLTPPHTPDYGSQYPAPVSQDSIRRQNRTEDATSCRLCNFDGETKNPYRHLADHYGK